MQTYSQQKPESIQALFNTIAKRYDRANSLMSFHLHALWNRTLAAIVLRDSPIAIIDLCSGTGEIAFRMVHSAPVQLVDFSEKMLDVAKSYAKTLPEELQNKLQFLQANVEELPLKDASFSHATIAYGIRNVQNHKKCLQEMYRVLTPAGKACILELTRPKNSGLRLMHGLYMRLALPLIGRWLAKDKQAYQYLQRSIETFVSPERLTEIAKEVGFRKATIMPLTFGIATLITLEK
jgi:demethylmenaquinone methyltransferase / 2-methoxy-6-polyprenyl-1,4-benzoquinol methylase